MKTHGYTRRNQPTAEQLAAMPVNKRRRAFLEATVAFYTSENRGILLDGRCIYPPTSTAPGCAAQDTREYQDDQHRLILRMRTRSQKTMRHTFNQLILRQLTTAPESQLSRPLVAKLMACNENRPEDIKSLFSYIYSLSEEHRSSFVAAMLDPRYTHLPEYSRQVTPANESAAEQFERQLAEHDRAKEGQMAAGEYNIYSPELSEAFNLPEIGYKVAKLEALPTDDPVATHRFVDAEKDIAVMTKAGWLIMGDELGTWLTVKAVLENRKQVQEAKQLRDRTAGFHRMLTQLKALKP